MNQMKPSDRIRKHRAAVNTAKLKGIKIDSETVQCAIDASLVCVLEAMDVENIDQVEPFLALYNAKKIVGEWLRENPDAEFEIEDPFDGVDDDILEILNDIMNKHGRIVDV